MTIHTNAADAIQHSIKYDCIAVLEAQTLDDGEYAIEDAALTLEHECDSTRTGDTIDVWGWTDGTPEGEHAWRVEIRVAEREEITDEQIFELKQESGVAGDHEQVAICERALAGDEDAIAECARVIDAARAMQD